MISPNFLEAHQKMYIEKDVHISISIYKVSMSFPFLLKCETNRTN